MSWLRFLGKAMRISGLIAVGLAIAWLYVIPILQIAGSSPTWEIIQSWLRQNFMTSSGVIQILVVFIPLGTLIYGGNHVSHLSIERDIRLEEKILGMLKAYGRISLADLSSKLGLTVTETEQRLASIRGSRDIVFSISDSMIVMPGFERSRPIKEVEKITREVVAVACKYCGGLIPMGSASCPECGASLKVA
jgi:hypothetical protein